MLSAYFKCINDVYLGAEFGGMGMAGIAKFSDKNIEIEFLETNIYLGEYFFFLITPHLTTHHFK